MNDSLIFALSTHDFFALDHVYMSIRNGSKEVIDDYLDQTKAQVIESEQLLRKMLKYLNIPTLPPLQGKL